MNIKYISVLLLVFFIAITAVSAANDNITNDNNVLAVKEYCEDLSICDANTTINNSNNECLSIPQDNTTLNNSNNECLSIPQDNTTLNNSNSECLSVPNDNVSLASVNNLPSTVSVESKLSSANDQPKLSIPANQEDSKLTSIYNKVYSKKVWRTVGLFAISFKYKWSNKVMTKLLKKRAAYIKKRTARTIIIFMKKGWTYDRIYYTTHYGRSAVTCRYYAQFYKTVYYNGYGKILYVN